MGRFSRGDLRLSRIESFSDSVFAIVVTILVLELTVPVLRDRGSPLELWGRLLQELPKFLSWLISFIIVCKFWLNHNWVLGLANRANYGLAWLNSIFLMTQAFIPFPTAVMGEYATNPLAVSLFGVVMATTTLLFIALQLYIEKNLLKPELAGTLDPHGIQKGLVGSLGYLVGAAAAWYRVEGAFLVYLLTPLFFIVPSQGDQPKRVRK